MKFRVTKEGKSYQVTAKDEDKRIRIIRPNTKDEEVCPKCHKNVSECVCSKEEEIHDEEPKLTKEQLKGIEELIELLPDLKKLLEAASKEEEKESEKESEEKAEEEESEEEEKEEENSEIEVDSEILLEESDDDKTIESEEFEEEEDVLEDEGGEDVHDSILNPGTIETSVSDSNKDTVSREIEVAEAWSKRYDSLLNHK